MARIILKGTPISPGIAIGPLCLLGNAHLYEKRHIEEEDIQAEIESLERASAQVRDDLLHTLQNLPPKLSEYAEIIAAQIELARDPQIMQGAKARIRRRKICAAWALSETIEELRKLFSDMADPYLCDRAQDIKIIGRSLGNALDGVKNSFQCDFNGILAAFDLSPAHVLELQLDGIQGLATVEGGITSHTAILARGLKVPAVVGVMRLFEVARYGEIVIVDGFSGSILFGPSEKDLEIYRRSRAEYQLFETEAQNSAKLPAKTRDGRQISVYANVDNRQEAVNLEEFGAEGIGLYRTEFSYLGDCEPDEEQLVEEYSQIAAAIAPKRAVFRTLDLGADKLLPAQEALHEPNPALGLRGIRFCLQRKNLFRMQLRALLRAGTHGNMAIMLPMVSALGEVLETKNMIAEISSELLANNIPHRQDMPLGVMIETPAAIMIGDALAAHCDFISLGTNDLLHYLLAIDRNNRHVAYLHDPLHPAFVRSLKQAIDAAHKYGREVSICGELASDAFAIMLLLGMGIDSLSAAPRFLPSIKHTLRRLDAGECAKLAQVALNEFDEEKTKCLLRAYLHDSLGSALSFQNHIITADDSL